MRKRRIYNLICFISVAIFATLIVLQNKNGKFEQLNVTDEDYKNIIISREYTEDLLIKDFKMNGFPVALSRRNENGIDSISKLREYPLELEQHPDYPEGNSGMLGDRYLYSIIEGQKSAYNPLVNYNYEGERVKVAIKDAHITEDRIKSNYEYKMVAYTSSKYHEYIINVTTLPIIQIDYDNKISKWDYSDAKINVFDNRKLSNRNVYATDARIRLRGASTIDFPKRAYRISLKEESIGLNNRKSYQSLLGLREDDDWLLYPAYNDQEKVRNVFCSNLWKNANANHNKFGVDNGMEYRFCELLINGEYRGLYALGYPIDVKQMGVNTSEIGKPLELMFKKTYWDDEKEYAKDDEGEVEGYRICYKLSEIEEVEDAYEDYAWSVLRNYWIDVYHNYDAYEIRRHTDMENAIEFYLFVNLIQGEDHITRDNDLLKNAYITFKLDSDHYSALFTPWDMDNTWGNRVSQSNLTNQEDAYGISPNESFAMKSGPINRLIELDDSEIMNQIKQSYVELRSCDWSEAELDKQIDTLEDSIFGSGAYFREMQRWPNGTYLDEPTKGLNYFKDYVHKRMEYLDKEITG